MIEQYGRQAGFLLDEGCTPSQVDKAIEKFGFAMGPFRMGDLAGNDIGWAVRKRRSVEFPDMVYSKTADQLCELGRFGQKTGAGWYDYVPGKRDALPSDVVNNMVIEHRKALGIAPRKISDAEIIERLVFAMVNEAAHILEEGIAAKASDIDMVYLTGYGFPLWRGGPMLYADTVGLGNVVRNLGDAINKIKWRAFFKNSEDRRRKCRRAALFPGTCAKFCKQFEPEVNGLCCNLNNCTLCASHTELFKVAAAVRWYSNVLPI